MTRHTRRRDYDLVCMLKLARILRGLQATSVELLKRTWERQDLLDKSNASIGRGRDR
eukprot:jgi/Botrbrau1/22925/Bobra.0030s0003.1